MILGTSPTIHNADDAALGFYYQTFFALLMLLEQATDDATVCVEGLDDIEFVANNETLLLQLKHSLAEEPAEIYIKSKAIWRTLKVWIDVLPSVELSSTSFHLVAVGRIDPNGPLALLNAEKSEDRTPLLDALITEAQRVVDAYNLAHSKGETPLPHKEKIAGCKSFLGLDQDIRKKLIERMSMRSGSPNIAAIEQLICKRLVLIPERFRSATARKLVGWWDREIVYSLCGKRSRLIHVEELQSVLSEFISDIVHDKLVPEFESANPPKDYQPDGMLTRQIELVGGLQADISKAIREEWRARAQRSKWINARLGMATQIDTYDALLEESWHDLHSPIVEVSAAKPELEKKALGLNVLRWTHETAPGSIRAFSEGWNAPYYIRGSYQVLAISLRVGWHPEFSDRLKEAK